MDFEVETKIFEKKIGAFEGNNPELKKTFEGTKYIRMHGRDRKRETERERERESGKEKREGKETREGKRGRQ